MSVRFYLKCVDRQGATTTYRFGSERDLLGFVEQSSTLGLAIVDTHMAFYDVELLAPVFGLNLDSIDHMDINLAKDGSQYANAMPSDNLADTAINDDNPSDDNQVITKKPKKDKSSKLPKKTKNKPKPPKKLKKKAKNDKAKKHKGKAKKRK